MDENFRLVFRAEMLDGQHRAVVRRRLVELLKVDDDVAETLFSGKPVVIRRGVDRETATRYQSLFARAGARLRVMPEAAASSGEPPADVGRQDGESSFSVVKDYEPPAADPPREIQAPDFSVARLGADLVEAAAITPASVAAPDLEVAELGSDLADEKDVLVVDIPEPDFELAEVGADLVVEPRQPVAVDVGPLNFELAEVGADIGVPGDDEDATAPDVSHLKLVDR